MIFNLLVGLLFSLNTYAFNERQLIEIYEVHQRAINNYKTKKKNLSLARFDLGIGIGAEGDVGLISAGLNSAIELIWQKNKGKYYEGDDIHDEEIELNYSTTPEDLYKSMKASIDQAVKLDVIKPKIRRKIIRKLKKDAERISLITKNLITMPAIGPWYINGFFKNYHFGLDGSLLSLLSVGYDKRVRFRFKILNTPLKTTEPEELTPGQKKMRKLMMHFEKLRQRQKQNVFNFKRAWVIHEIGVNLNLLVANVSHSRGIQVEYKRISQDNFIYSNEEVTGGKFNVPGVLNNLILSIFSNRYYEDIEDTLSLHQVRIKYEANTELDFQVVGLEKESTIQYHYMR
jgi:hypothetical protein